MNKSEVLELKRRLKKDACTFTRMCGCYVDGERNRIVKLEETFLNLDEEEFYKYLEIARKALSGVIGNQLLELEFPLEEEAVGGRQHFLSALTRTRDPAVEMWSAEDTLCFQTWQSERKGLSTNHSLRNMLGL